LCFFLLLPYIVLAEAASYIVSTSRVSSIVFIDCLIFLGGYSYAFYILGIGISIFIELKGSNLLLINFLVFASYLMSTLFSIYVSTL
jgi:hypothetical protein